jgi:hypothetical protein
MKRTATEHALSRRDEEDAIRLCREMWSIDRIATLFGTGHDAMRRVVARRAVPRVRHQPDSRGSGR